MWIQKGGRLVVNLEEGERVREIFKICEGAGTLAGGIAGRKCAGAGDQDMDHSGWAAARRQAICSVEAGSVVKECSL